tara:strand:+ start:1625 stop:1801 length:177 start_codon:yes stop_codon:yes gene_type:complete
MKSEDKLAIIKTEVGSRNLSFRKLPWKKLRKRNKIKLIRTVLKILEPSLKPVCLTIPS